MELSTILPIATLFIGWLLGEGSQVLRKRNDRVQAMNQALADLLEIRHRLKGNQFVFSMLTDRFKMPPEAIHAIQSFLPSTLKIDEKLKERFNRALDLLAAHDPFLAHFLRSKDAISEFDHFFNDQMFNDPDSAKYIQQIRTLIENEYLPHIDEAILKLAESSSFNMKAKTEDYLKETEEPLPQIQEFAEQIEKLIVESSQKK